MSAFCEFQEESDVEWKFARSQLYMEYISNEHVLPVPLNLMRIPRAIVEWCCDGCEEEEEEEKEDTDLLISTKSFRAPFTKNGVEVKTLKKC